MKSWNNVLVAFFALLGVCSAEAASVTQEDACYAARRWATSGATLETSLGKTVVASETVMATNDVALHVVRFDGGTAFVSSDTEIEPIIAFTTSTNFSAEAGSTLWALLKRDTIVRHAALDVARSPSRMATASAGFQSQMAASAASASGKWAALLEGRNAQQNLRSSGATVPNLLSGVSDVRRAPLVKSQWSQTTAKGQYCYNLYTPDHDPCGCTATAMSQIMRYHEYPTVAVAARTYPCEVDGKAKDLTMKGGTYDWAKMTLCPSTSSYVKDNWAAIGKLTSDVGIAIRSSYTSGAGSSYVSLVAEALKEAFGYANGACIFNWAIAEEAYDGDGRVHTEAGLHKLAVREKVIYANLDAKCPVEFGVYGYGDGQIGNGYYWEGHAIVGDGYGYSEYNGEQVPYVHINLGWHGVDDAWYNIPEIHSPNSGSYVGSSGTAFTILSAAAYNLFPTKTGNIVSGRAHDDDGEPLEGYSMSIRAAGSSEVIDTCVTDEKGIYAFIVPGGADYDITCANPSSGLTATHTVTVPKETLECSDKYGVYTETDDNVGNYWGHDADFEVAEAAVRIGTTTYTSLDKALAAAQADDTLEILCPVALKNPATIGVDCTIVAVNADPFASAVNCRTGGLSIDSGVRVLFRNVVFTNAASVAVAAGGVAALAGKLALGPVTTADSAGIELAGTLENSVTVTAPDMGRGEVFGTVSSPEAAESARRLLNAVEEELGGVAVGGQLQWGVVPVDDADAVVRLTQGGTKTNFRSLRTLFKCVTADAEIAVLKDCTLTEAVSVANEIVFAGGTEGVTLTASGEAGFDILGGALIVSNLTLTGSSSDALFRVGALDGLAGELVFERDAVLTDFTVTSSESYCGAVCVLNGRATLCEGSSLLRCRASGSEAYGGGVYAYGEDASVALDGTSVTGCSATMWGGGVCAHYGAQILVSGDTVVKGNTVNDTNWDTVEDDICSSDPVQVVGPVTSSEKSIGIEVDGLVSVGDAFATCEDGATGASAENSAAAFFNTYDGTLGATYDAAGRAFVWAEIPEKKTTDEEHATVRVIYPDATTNYYATIEIAFSDLQGDCRVELMASTVDLRSDLAVSDSVTLTSDPALDGGALLGRTSETGSITVNAGATLTVTNVTLSGSGSEGGRLLYVDGGSLVLGNGGGVRGFCGKDSRDASAIVIYNRATFTMKDGSFVENCTNTYVDAFKDVQTGTGGGVLVDVDSTAYLQGGRITGCAANYGGLAVCNRSTAYVSGNFLIRNNTDLAGNAGDLMVEDESDLFLAAPLSEDAWIGRAVGYRADTNLAAVVQDWTEQWTAAALEADAAKFRSNDWPGCWGVAVTNGTETLIVWSKALAKDDDDRFYYVDGDGTRYGAVEVHTCREEEAGVRVRIEGAADYRYYRCLNDAFACIVANATVETSGVRLDGPGNWVADVLETNAVISSAICLTDWKDRCGGTIPAIGRDGDVRYKVTFDGSLTVSNVTLCGAKPVGSGSSVQTTGLGLVAVDGGALTLAAGATVTNVVGTLSRKSNAIVVTNGGTFTMLPGSLVTDCTNTCADASGAEGCGVAVRLEDSTAFLRGGEIRKCFGHGGGAVYFGGNSTACLGGGFTATMNASLESGLPTDNLQFSKTARLVLDDEKATKPASGSGVVYLYEGEGGDSNKFGTVSWEWTSLEALTNSATMFRHDKRTDSSGNNYRGVAVSNKVETVLVWEDALKEIGGSRFYEEAGNRYVAVGDDPCDTPLGPLDPPGPEPEYGSPVAFKSITRVSDVEWALVITNRVQNGAYRLLWTEDLSKGFTTTGAWETATTAGEWKTNVLFTAPAPTSVFWKAESKDGENPVE